MKQLFISYSRKDTEFTRRITERLEADGPDASHDSDRIIYHPVAFQIFVQRSGKKEVIGTMEQ